MIQPIGYFKLYRELFNKPIWFQSTPEQKTILLTLLAMAPFKGNEWEWKGQKFNTKPGQFVTSLDSIVINSGKGITVQNVRTALKRFEKLNFLTNESTKQGRLITIENWQFYQGEEVSLTNNQQRPNKDLTNNQQRPNKDLTPIEEGNKEKKDKKVRKTKAQIFNDNVKIMLDEFNIFEPVTSSIFEFIEFRKSIKKPMSELAVKKFLKKLLDMSNDPNIQIKMMDEAIANGWQTVYPLKDNQQRDKKSVLDEWDACRSD